MKILVLNAGSSSQKSCLYELGDTLPTQPPQPLWSAQIDGIPNEAKLKVKTAQGQYEATLPSDSRIDATTQMLETLWSGNTAVITSPDEIDIVGHRVVHGGQAYRQSVFITSEVKAAIAQLATLAPAHNPANLEGIEVMTKILDVPQVAVFDTSFHAHMPETATTYPGPYAWLDQGIRRYGFHGISHQYCSDRAAQILGRELKDLRLITCHLGNGCSLAAIKEGCSIDTTMGFTPLEGLMMGSRSGSIDAGILIHLLRQSNYTADQFERLLNKESGLLGISGLSNDMRQILKAIAQKNERAQLAFDIYIHRLRSEIGSMLASLGGLDALVFTAGIGENSPTVRANACQAFGFLGLKLDLEKNDQSPIDQDIATPDSTIRVLIVHTEEDWAIARECWQLMH